jgi:hypothetical protein
MADHQVTVHFVHPTDSSRILTATVGETATPHYLLAQLVNEQFLTAPGAGAQYKLIDSKTNNELPDHTTLVGAGLPAEVTLNVLHSVTGA